MSSGTRCLYIRACRKWCRVAHRKCKAFPASAIGLIECLNYIWYMHLQIASPSQVSNYTIYTNTLHKASRHEAMRPSATQQTCRYTRIYNSHNSMFMVFELILNARAKKNREKRRRRNSHHSFGASSGGCVAQCIIICLRCCCFCCGFFHGSKMV